VHGRYLRNLLVSITALGAIYGLYVRPWQLRWGATDAEVERELPGDGLIPEALLQTTRAITIDASPGAVWPWLAQLGQGRGGFYSYAVLENAFGLDIQNADEVVWEWQDLRRGDDISLAPDGEMPMRVVLLRPERALVLRSFDVARGHPVEPGSLPRGEIACSWAFVLTPLPGDTTRLVVRFRAAWRQTAPAWLLRWSMLEPAHFVMERGMLLGIRSRAERWTRERIAELVSGLAA
jgi:hypothetical protein